MSGKKVEGFPLHAPVLHDLRWKLDKIPGNVRPGQAAHRNSAESVMQKMAELMKYRLHFTMGQKRRPAASGRAQITAYQAEMRLSGIRITGYERIHPGAPTLVFPWEPVCVESSEQQTGIRVLDPVILNCGIPARDIPL